MPQVNVSVPPALKAWIDEQVAAGRYSSPSDLIRQLIRDAQEDAAEHAWLAEKLEEGINSGAPRDAFEFADELKSRYGRSAA